MGVCPVSYPVSRLRGVAAAAVCIGALATASSAAAANIFLDKAEMFTPTTATISGPNYPTVTAYDGPVLFTANYGTHADLAHSFQFLGFCVDVFDEINVGINSPLTINLAYHDGVLTTNNAEDSAFAPHGHLDLINLTQTQKDDISALVNFGTHLWNADSLTDPSHLHMSTTLVNQLGGVQGAIWKIENQSSTIHFNVTGGNANVTNYINTYSSSAFLAGLPTGKIDTVFDSHQPFHQAFAFAVPEPSTWAMLIVGFGAMGAVLRRRRVGLA